MIFVLGATGVAEADFGLLETGVTDDEALTDALPDPLPLKPSQMNATELNSTSAKHFSSYSVESLNVCMPEDHSALEGNTQLAVL